jgi:hypothetical protein
MHGGRGCAVSPLEVGPGAGLRQGLQRSTRRRSPREAPAPKTCPGVQAPGGGPGERTRGGGGGKRGTRETEGHEGDKGARKRQRGTKETEGQEGDRGRSRCRDNSATAAQAHRWTGAAHGGQGAGGAVGAPPSTRGSGRSARPRTTPARTPRSAQVVGPTRRTPLAPGLAPQGAHAWQRPSGGHRHALLWHFSRAELGAGEVGPTTLCETPAERSKQGPRGSRLQQSEREGRPQGTPFSPRN